ncbi:MAG TPA: glycine cleavage system aminomethyltransferase GcvT [Caulobacteraceae bacterium]|jgi:aminomethyltransferase
MRVPDENGQPDALKQTPLHGAHLELGARMVGFAGYDMPIQYRDGIVAEHKWTRGHAGLFDVSHMGPGFITLDIPASDPERAHECVAEIVERLTPGDFKGLKPGKFKYTLLLNEEGGILDDLLIGRPRHPGRQGALTVVVNSGTKEQDFALLEETCGDDGTVHRSDEDALLALQGPEAAAVLADICPDCTRLTFMDYGFFTWEGVGLNISRSGYTGEDGFEILVPREAARAFWDRLMQDERVRPIGLGARDSLRLEAGLPLYGHDIDESTSPIEAGLNFAVNKRRKEARDFPGAERMLRELGGELARVRVGLLVEGAPAREGAEIADADGKVVGRVTSGGFSPTLGRPIAMGYVPPAMSAEGTALKVLVRGRAQAARVAAMPFTPHRYVRKV